MKIGIVAGEKSGDLLGAELIRSIRLRYPDAEFFGLAGPLMIAEGAVSIDEMSKISIFGLEGLFSSLSDILSIRKRLTQHFIANPPDVFVGIDVPDFNLRLEINLKKAGIPTVHYVSPTVWAWRTGRVKKIKRAVDLMLTLFPFEETFYLKHNQAVRYVGHPLAEQVLSWQTPTGFRESLAKDTQTLIAVLPGSRMSEVTRLAAPMIEAAMALHRKDASLKFVIPSANERVKRFLEEKLEIDQSVVQIIDGQSRDLFSVADLAVLASGTAALEAALFACPMVVMYKVAWLSAAIYGHTIAVEHYSMPNHLINPPIVPELIQGQATAENLQTEVARLLADKNYYNNMKARLAEITPLLALSSGDLACEAIVGLLESQANIIENGSSA